MTLYHINPEDAKSITKPIDFIGYAPRGRIHQAKNSAIAEDSSFQRMYRSFAGIEPVQSCAKSGELEKKAIDDSGFFR
jgi:hypothetical protein